MLTKPQSHQDTDLPMNYNRMLIIRILQIWYSGSSPNGHCRPPSQNSLFLPSHRNSVFLHSRKRPAPVMDTFFASRGFPLTELPLYLCYAHIRLFTTNNSIKTHFHIKSLHLTSFWKELCLDLEDELLSKFYPVCAVKACAEVKWFAWNPLVGWLEIGLIGIMFSDWLLTPLAVHGENGDTAEWNTWLKVPYVSVAAQ